ncbi:hypothetical protein LZ30DRAFT_610530 [Colletotrichum cereale]|nr:hypothetical protein LZ30DRAFT_610530 [Colletotrichum cereale]
MSSPRQTGLPKLGNVLYQTVFQFPYSAYSVPRVPDQNKMPSSSDSSTTPHERTKPEYQNAHTLSEPLASFCTSSNTVSGFLAEDPTLTPGHAWKQLANHYESNSHEPKDIRDIGRGEVTDDELEVAFNFANVVKLYHDALCTLNDHPAHGMASPPLLGSSGVAPLTILSVIPDMARHMSNLIVRAQKDVILATNFWQNSTASKYITNAIKEASRRAGERGIKITMKVLYDRGSPKQLFDPHYLVPEKEYTGKAVGLPSKQEIPNVDLQVMNYHDPMLGTFHSKFMVVDRKIGLVQSNNIQDNDNLEMMVHVEGPIVDSLYDMALLTWHKGLDPPLPTRDKPGAVGEPGSLGLRRDSIFTPEGTLKGHRVVLDPARIPRRAAAYGSGADQILMPGEADGFHGSTAPSPPTQDMQNGQSVSQTAPAAEEVMANGALPEHTHEDPHYDEDIVGEIARVQAAVSAKPNESQMQAISRHLNHTVNKDFKGTAPECGPADEMTPYIPLPTHEAFPIALVNRPPYGPPNHRSVGNPQNAAWLSALRNAEKSVFIQTPTLNAEPLVPAMIEACERGIDVFAYVCLGYNDAGELLPMQGGHNEMVAAHMYEKLSPHGRQHLHYFWYVGKDQTRPIVAGKKKRSCHVKLMIVDESIAIVGSGNQDTQSWFHSQEVNMMLESRDVCKVWIDALRRNQNTHRYGALSREDGVWRDDEGKEADGATGVDPGRFSWAKGLVGAIKRLEGTGGF